MAESPHIAGMVKLFDSSGEYRWRLLQMAYKRDQNEARVLLKVLKLNTSIELLAALCAP